MGADWTPRKRNKPCQYHSCEPNGKIIGYNRSNPDLIWVNGPAVAAMRLGSDILGPQRWGGQLPELAITGVHGGRFTHLGVQTSADVHACAWATHRYGIPCIVFATETFDPQPWNTTDVGRASLLYAELATDLINQLARGEKPLLPHDTMLVVNFPPLHKQCKGGKNMTFVLSRSGWPMANQRDIEICGRSTLPVDEAVHDSDNKERCFATIVPIEGINLKTVRDHVRQTIVKDRLRPLLDCIMTLDIRYPVVENVVADGITVDEKKRKKNEEKEKKKNDGQKRKNKNKNKKEQEKQLRRGWPRVVP